MTFLTKFFYKRRLKKQERLADKQFLDAIETLRETTALYLDLLAQIRQCGDIEASERLQAKLNNQFEHTSKGWDGEISVLTSISSTCNVPNNQKRLRL